MTSGRPLPAELGLEAVIRLARIMQANQETEPV